MAKIKVILDRGESPLDSDIQLYKALHPQMTGDITESFEDPAMISVSQRFEEILKLRYPSMIAEIIAELEKEYGGNF